MSELTIQYDPAPTLERFHKSAKRRRGVMGPVGSGKSTAMCWELFSKACKQEPGPDGKRKTRFAVVRSTYRQLKDTTIRTWLDWFGTTGKIHSQDMSFVISHGDVHCELLFRSLDRPKDVGKLLSLELTGAWVNEAREIPRGLIDALDDRTGRFPAVKDGGCTWRGLIMDTNPSDDDHWWYRMAETESLDTWEFFRQPGGLYEVGPDDQHDLEVGGHYFRENPAAENLENLEPRFYLDRGEGKSPDHIRVYYCAEYGFVKEGKPIYPEYRDQVHVASEILAPVSDLPIYVGLDFGLTPAAVFGQIAPNGRWLWFDEIVTEDMGVERFSELLGTRLRGRYSGHSVELYGDPTGDVRAPTDERTPFQILGKNGIKAEPTATNDFVIRREAVASVLNRMIDGGPGALLSPVCATLRKGMAGAYCYRRLQTGTEKYSDKPDKGSKYSHACDALQYMLLGAGEGKKVIGRERKAPRAMKAQRAYDVMGY